MSSQFVIKYDAARAALAEAKTVKEVLDIKDQSELMREFARIAKDRELEADAIELRVRAERQLGAMIEAQKETVGLNKGGGPGRGKTGVQRTPVLSEAPTLEEAGIDKNLAKRARKAVHVPAKEFETAINAMRTKATETNERLSANIIQQNDPVFQTTVKKAKKAAAEPRMEGQFSYIECLADLAVCISKLNMAVNAIVRHKNTSEARINRDVKHLDQTLSKLRAWAGKAEPKLRVVK